jgi:hypothetical protein
MLMFLMACREFIVSHEQNQFYFLLFPYFVGPCPYRDIGSNFWKFYLVRTNLTLDELVSLVKVFRVFRLEWIILVFRVRTQ